MISLNPFSWFGNKPNELKLSEAGYAISGFGAGQPVWSSRDYKRFAEEAYVKNAIAYRCMLMIAQACASVPLMLVDSSGDKVEGHPITNLLERPSPNTTLKFLIESIATYIQISGNAYIEAVGPENLNTPPIELWTLRPDRMQVIAGSQGVPSSFQYEANGVKKSWPVDVVSGKSRVLHIKRFNPIDDWYGLSPVEAAAFSLDRHNEAGAHNMSVLQNGATPSGAMIFKPVKKNGTDVSPPIEILEAAEKRLMERYSGTNNSGKPMALGGNVEWVSFGMTMEQLQLTESKLDAARDICVSFGVPIELLLPGQSTYNNRREAKLGFYEETVLPALGDVVNSFNIWLCPQFDDGLSLVADVDAVEALSLRRELRQETTVKLWESGLLSRDVALEALKFAPEPELPQRKIDANVLAKLVDAAQKDTAMFEPLWRYLKFVGLVDQNQTLEQFVADSASILDSLPTTEEDA